MERRLKRKLEVPLDAVSYILLGLPVKTLSRFRCVSKPWCSLISDPLFQKEHTRRSRQSPLLLITSGQHHEVPVRFATYDNQGSLLREFVSNGVPLYSWPIAPVSLRFKLIPSSLELVCLRHNNDGSIRLCNPSTQQMIDLPKRPEQEHDRCVGFGYSPSTKEYKVVRFFTLDVSDKDCCCEVFTLGNDVGWKKARTPPPYMPCDDVDVPFLHGAIHLMPQRDQAPDDQYIAAFDLTTEEYKGIPFPDIYFREGMSVSQLTMDFAQLSDFKGSLCTTFGVTSEMLELWLLKDYHKGNWVKQYNIDLSSLSVIRACPWAILGDDRILLNVRRKLLNVRRKNYTELLCYNTKENRVTETMGINCEATFYVESFLPLENCNHHEESYNHHMELPTLLEMLSKVYRSIDPLHTRGSSSRTHRSHSPEYVTRDEHRAAITSITQQLAFLVSLQMRVAKQLVPGAKAYEDFLRDSQTDAEQFQQVILGTLYPISGSSAGTESEDDDDDE